MEYIDRAKEYYATLMDGGYAIVFDGKSGNNRKKATAIVKAHALRNPDKVCMSADYTDIKHICTNGIVTEA